MTARRGNHDSEGGYVLVLLTIMFTLLMLFAGYSVDAGNWNLHRNETQTAAEAAALGGVAFLPDDLVSAQATAEQIALHHGYDSSQVSVALGSGNNQLEVTITEDVSNYFVRVVGRNTTTITSTATAEFEQPVEMGSPEHVLGNDPETGFAPDYWLSIASRNVRKELGDRFNTRFCQNGSTANCAGTSNLGEYTPSGYKYAVRVTDTSQPLRIQIFDPAWVWTGSTCNIPNWPTAAEIAYLQSIDDGSYPEIPVGYYNDAGSRYAGGDSAWCSGDDRPGNNGPATRYTVRLPDNSPWDDTDNTAVNISGCAPETFPAYTPTSIYAAPTQSIAEFLDPAVGTDDEWEVLADGDFTFAEVFRRWVTICEIPASSPWLVEGEYIIQVQTTNSTAGQNRFSLRGGPPDAGGGVLDVGQATFARGRLPIYANTGAADIQFFLARVPPSSGERILEVTFFDVGDASAPGTLSVVPPSGALTSGYFPNCDYTLAGVPIANTNCAVSNVLDTNGYGEQIVEATVTIPSQNDPVTPYWCDVTNPSDCWVTVRAQFLGGLTDATTWTANLIGDAVRIIDDD
ncbi:MAG: pilus assembly protein TadG-related protein [Acidimicrobiales bacterium]